jgi:hypothetical protein
MESVPDTWITWHVDCMNGFTMFPWMCHSMDWWLPMICPQAISAQLSEAGAPGGLFYDTDWGGLPSRVGYNATWHSEPATRCSWLGNGMAWYGLIPGIRILMNIDLHRCIYLLVPVLICANTMEVMFFLTAGPFWTSEQSWVSHTTVHIRSSG